MKAQAKAQTACDITIGVDHGSLRLQFPGRHSPLWEALEGKSLKGKPKYLPLGRHGYKDNPEDWKRATALAVQMEADLDHPEWEKLFDPTLAKYGLGGGKYAKLADVLQMPGTVQTKPEITVGEMWEAYLEWKKTVVEETTFVSKYRATLSSSLKGLIWNRTTMAYEQSGTAIVCLRLDDKKEIDKALSMICIKSKKDLLSSLNQAFDFCKSKGLLQNAVTENPFLLDKYTTNGLTTQQKYANKIVNGEEKEWHEVQDEKLLELDRRAFTREERDIIIKAFYMERPPVAGYAPLIEFYFLTGCRTSEALPLTWKDIDFERNIVRFNKSLGQCTKKLKDTKTGEARVFYFSESSRLRELLLKLKSDSLGNLIFPNKKGKYISVGGLANVWLHNDTSKKLKDGTTKEYYYPGVVTKLAEEGAISGYLSPYHTRHTYITLTAHANAHNNNALLHIATACGNSVDVILRHYLGVDESVQITEV